MGPEKKPSKTTSIRKQNVPLRVQHGAGAGSGWGTTTTNTAPPQQQPASGNMWNLQSMKQKYGPCLHIHLSFNDTSHCFRAVVGWRR